jgi:hypothetical protein
VVLASQAVVGLRRHVTFYAIVLSLVVLGALALSLPASPVIVATGLGGAPGDNDAASGTDAGNSPESALLLSNARRNWNANLTPPGSDSDWYRLAPSGAFCAVVDATTNAPGHVTLATSATRDVTASREAAPHKATRVVLAGQSGRAALFGLEPPMLRLMSGSDGATPGPGRYTFSLVTQTYADLDPQNDGESPEAGATIATAAPLPAECGAGRLGSADAADTYTFTVSDPRALTLSLAIARGDALQARIVAPTGLTYATLMAGDAIDVWADRAGTWSVVVEGVPTTRPAAPGFTALPILAASGASLSTTDYILGITDGPDPAPCRPSCR